MQDSDCDVPDDDIPLLVDHNSAVAVVVAFAKERVGHQVKEDIAEETTRRERDHGVERRGLKGGRNRQQDDVGDRRDVECAQD